MAQILRSRKTRVSGNTSKILNSLPVASCNHMPVQSVVYAQDTLETELHELRYSMERKVEQRTAQLVKRITLLESCNTVLSEKLAQANRDLATLIRQLATVLPEGEGGGCQK